MPEENPAGSAPEADKESMADSPSFSSTPPAAAYAAASMRVRSAAETF